MNLDPQSWYEDIVPDGLREVDFRNRNQVLADRYARGVRLWRELHEIRWWRFVRRRELKHRIAIVRDEYREKLTALVEQELRNRTYLHVVNLDAQELVSRKHRERLRDAQAYGGPHLTDHDPEYVVPVIVPVEVPTDYTNNRDSSSSFDSGGVETAEDLLRLIDD